MLTRPDDAGARRVLGGEDGSTLLLYPFAVLIVFALGAIAVDAAVLFQAHREAVDVASGVAADIAGVVDEAAFADDGTIRIDRDRAGDVLAFANTVTLDDHPNQLRCGADVAPDGAGVAVTCDGTGRPLLLPIGGDSPLMTFSATVTATADPRG